MIIQPVKIYTIESQLRHPMSLVIEMLRDLRASRELAWRLAIRDISAQYRQTILGIFWAFILPLVNTITWIFLNKSGVVSIQETPIPYSAYVFSGTMLWAIFMEALNAPLKQTVSSKAMLAKINFPREALVVSGIYQTIFNGTIKVILLLLALIFFGIHPSWQLIFFPIAVISLILAGTAVGLLLTPIGVLYTDISKAIPLLMQFFMYISPVVFPLPKSGAAATMFKLNPITPIILTARDWLTGSSPEFLRYFTLVNIGLLLLLLTVWVVFRAAIPILIERMSS